MDASGLFYKRTMRGDSYGCVLNQYDNQFIPHAAIPMPITKRENKDGNFRVPSKIIF